MNKKTRFILILLYIVFLIGLTEGLARLVFLNSKLSDRLWAYEDLSWRRSWIKRHNNTGKEIYYTFDIYDSSKGWISKPNIKDMQVFDNKVLNTNSKGFRGKAEYSYSKDQNKIRILIVGDSHTFGEGVSDNETYPYYLQEIIPNVEVMNLGMHGYGHDQMLIFIKEEGIKYNPDIIILGYISLIFIFGEMSTGLGYGVSIISVGFSIFMDFLELLVAFIQAYVFTLLSALYFGMATEETHH